MTPRRMFSFATMMVSAQRRHAGKAGPAPRPEATVNPRALELVSSAEAAPRRTRDTPAAVAPTPWLQLA